MWWHWTRSCPSRRGISRFTSLITWKTFWIGRLRPRSMVSRALLPEASISMRSPSKEVWACTSLSVRQSSDKMISILSPSCGRITLLSKRLMHTYRNLDRKAITFPCRRTLQSCKPSTTWLSSRPRPTRIFSWAKIWAPTTFPNT